MHFSTIAHVLGTLLIVTGSSMALPIICSLYYNEGDLFSILISAIITVALGLPLWWVFRKNHDLNIKDGFFIAVFGWMLVSALSGLPFMIYGAIPSFTDAFFEMMSGYTTSGATILTDIEVVPVVLAKRDPFTRWYGVFDVNYFIPAPWDGWAPYISSRVESWSGDYQRKIQTAQ